MRAVFCHIAILSLEIQVRKCSVHIVATNSSNHIHRSQLNQKLFEHGDGVEVEGDRGGLNKVVTEIKRAVGGSKGAVGISLFLDCNEPSTAQGYLRTRKAVS